MTDMVFLADALDANRGGRLSEGQRRQLQEGLDFKHKGLLGSVARGFDRLAKDLEAGRVENVEGAITKRLGPSALLLGSTPWTSYEIRVANHQAGSQAFHTSRELHEHVPDAGFVRLFYLPRSRWVVNLERLPDPPVSDVSMQSAKEAVGGLAKALKARDRVGLAEARAQLDAMGRAAEKVVPTDVRSSGQRPEAGALDKAIVGSWSSPLLSVSFDEDGRLTAQLADGSDHQGRWSVDPEGRLHADLMGAPILADASVADDELTLVINNQALMLQRSSGQ